MTQLTSAERQKLQETISRRIGARGDGPELATAYLAAAHRHALARTTESSPVPTNLTVERSALLMEISKELKRVIEDHEIEAVFRVPRVQARAMRTTLLATYSDLTDDLSLAWALTDSTYAGRKKTDTVAGRAYAFDTEDKRAAFVSHLRRAGFGVSTALKEPSREWVAVIDDRFASKHLPKKA